ncbi:NAD(P)H-hydrate dehydratase [Thomasclavelia spiroformis]|uniref:NAD(P)H-hydrate dehydratase n=1 Tax=Thomasclavelia spiroformis TaxID=29348 RepID=UPI000B3AA084|nr:NAD(P)H-hydrate dehydratase [Thomasclavelia spiroformis]OUO72033.1 bifunctional ADP-dependent NAD(P)H-hydrate dehydratase/NAD(P)H-hydrate epimerase [Thomasclavelia spiroformis]
MYVATSKQMKAYDQALLNEGYKIEELVDKASDAILPHCRDYDKIVIVCGPGNNGADGLSLGIKLHLRARKVKLYCFGNPNKLSKANDYYIGQAQEIGVPITFMDEDDIQLFINDARKADVVIDAMFGFGLNSEVRGIAKTLVNEINNLYNVDIISIDIPTGLNPDTGIPYGEVIHANKTVTLTAVKQAFLNDECHVYTGEIAVELLEVKDLRRELKLAKLVNPLRIKHHLKPRDYYGHKGVYGKILHITGCDHYRGAALLSARAAVYTGSGIVCVYSSNKVIDALSTTIPECTSLIRNDVMDINLFDKYDAILIGSGLGLNEQSEQYVIDVLKNATCPLVIDGDALTIVSKHLDLLKDFKHSVILTPHHGEFKRLCDYEDELDMIEKVNQFALEYEVIVVLKGPNTIITDGKEIYRNITANKAMATAGMGDVLAGMISSFVGQGYSSKNAAILGTYIHGSCGDVIAENSYTVIPSKMINLIPKVMYRIIKE